MEQAQLIVTLISSVVVLLSALIGFIFSFVKVVKSKDLAHNKIQIMTFLMQTITEAEQLKNMTGVEKRRWVLSKIESFSKENGIVFDAETIGKAIDNIIDFTKVVNFPKKI